MKTPKPSARHLQQDLFARLLEAWGELKDDDEPLGPAGVLLEDFASESGRLVQALQGARDVDLAAMGIWQVGPLIVKGTPRLHPVATASVWVEDDVLNACLRVALIESGTDSPRVWGWRFDSAEQHKDGKPVPRPHAHAQQVTSWYQNGARCLVHRHKKDEQGAGCPWEDAAPAPSINETHPAFPLRGRTLPGLALAFIVSMHGTETAHEIFVANEAIRNAASQDINDDFDSILGAA
jgi:hypothetical protein